MDPIVVEWFKLRNNPIKVNESIVDFEKKTVCRDIFTSDDKLKPSIKKFLMDRYKEIIKKLNIEENRIKAYYIWGSITGHYYNPYTDLDAQIMVEYDSEEDWEEDLKKMREVIPAGYEYTESAGDHPLNFYIQKYNGQKYPATLDGIYDFEQDKWIKKQETTIDIGNRGCLEVATGWIRKAEQDIAELKRDLIDLKIFQENRKQIGTLKLREETFTGLVKSKESEIIYDVENLIMTFKGLKEIRTQNQKTIAENFKEFKGEIKVTPENVWMFSGIIAWKIIDSQGLINFVGGISTMYSKFKDKKMKSDNLIKELDKSLVPKNLWRHG